MSTICIPKETIDKLRKAIKSKEINIDNLYNLDSAKRNALFSKYVGKDNGKLFNVKYEQARIIAEKRAASDYVTASAKGEFRKVATQGEFAKKLLTPEETKVFALDKLDKQIKKIKELQDKIIKKIKSAKGEKKANFDFKLNKYKTQIEQLNIRKEDITNPQTDTVLKKINSLKGMMSDANYSELISAKMGHDISPAQGKYIIDKTIELKDLAKANEADKGGLTAEYYNARTSLDNYINHLNPNPSYTIIQDLADIGRNALITGISTPIKVLANYTNFFARKALQRIAHFSLSGENNDLINTLKQEDTAFSKATGNSRTQFTSMNDMNTVLGSHSSKLGSTRIAENFQTPDSTGSVGKGILRKIEHGIRKARGVSHSIAITLEHTIAYNYVFKRTFYDTLKFNSISIAKMEGLKGKEAISRAREIIMDANRVEPKTLSGQILRKNAQDVSSFITNTNDTWASKISTTIKNGMNKAVPYSGDLLEPMAKIPANVIANGIKNTLPGSGFYLYDLFKGRSMLSEHMPLETRYKGLIKYQKGLQGLIGVAGSTAVGLAIVSQLKPKDFKTDRYGGTFVHFNGLWINTEYFGRLAPGLAGMMAVKALPQKTLSNVMSSYLQGVGRTAVRIPGINVISDTAKQLTGKRAGHFLSNVATTRLVPSIGLDLVRNRKINRVFFGAHGLETDSMVVRDKYNSDWTRSTTAQLKQFKAKIGNDKFVQANKLYNKKVGDWIIKIKNNPKFKALTNDVKKKVVTAKRRKIKDEIFRQYSFRPARKRRVRVPRL